MLCRQAVGPQCIRLQRRQATTAATTAATTTVGAGAAALFGFPGCHTAHDTITFPTQPHMATWRPVWQTRTRCNKCSCATAAATATTTTTADPAATATATPQGMCRNRLRCRTVVLLAEVVEDVHYTGENDVAGWVFP